MFKAFLNNTNISQNLTGLLIYTDPGKYISWRLNSSCIGIKKLVLRSLTIFFLGISWKLVVKPILKRKFWSCNNILLIRTNEKEAIEIHIDLLTMQLGKIIRYQMKLYNIGWNSQVNLILKLNCLFKGLGRNLKVILNLQSL